MPERLLDVLALDAHYGDFQALFGVSLNVTEGEVVAVIGANGAGKSTLLKCIAGAMPALRDAIVFAGRPIGDLPAHEIVARGIALVPEGRRLFPSLTVEENLLIGGQLGRTGPWTLKRVYDLFPMLAERAQQPSTSLSGGQQQMVAIGRALMAMPRLLLLDEPSLGLAPHVVDQVFEVIAGIHADGVAVLLVEQNIVQAFAIAARAYVLEQGRIVAEGTPAVLARDARIREAYLGQQ